MDATGLPNFELKPGNPVTDFFLDQELTTFHDAIHFVRDLPYGRNQSRDDYLLVLEELKGTCSTKHALLAKIAEMHRQSEIQLMIVVFEMNSKNTPEIIDILEAYDIPSIPEAHVILQYNGKLYDFTNESTNAQFENILHQTPIEPAQIGDFKVSLHKSFISTWVADSSIGFEPEMIWNIREQCIERLGDISA